MKLTGTAALVTGGASGLGLATAEVLLAAGMSVTLVDVTDAVEAVGRRLGERAQGVTADVTDPDAIAIAVSRAADFHGPLVLAVNCAGIAVAQRTLSRRGPHDLAFFERVLRINLLGTFNVTRLAAQQMATNTPDENGERGLIVNTASVAAFEGQIGQVAYAASKGGVAAMTLPIARDLASIGIRCVAIAPGVFDTPMLAAMPEEVREALHRDVPHPHRLGHPLEFGQLVRDIAQNPYLNGEVIRLDGALRMPPS